jgi:hypothetical protein
MSQIEVERFLGRILTDPDFRARAASSLQSACSNEGIALSPEEMSCLRHINYFMFGHLAETLDDAIRRK